MTPSLTPTQLAVFDHVRDLLSVAHVAPSYSELQDYFGFRSKAEVARVLDALVARGLLVRTAAKIRNLALPSADGLDLLRVGTDELRAELERRGVPLRRARLIDHKAPGKPCAAPFCGERVVRGQIYCRAHWFALPRGLRADLLDGFRRHDEPAYADAYRRSTDYLAVRS